MDLKSGDEAIPAVALSGVVAKMSQKKLGGTLVGLNNITDEIGLIKSNPVIGTLNTVPPCRSKTTKIQLSKLEFKSPPKYGDCVTRRVNGQRGMFLGFINASKTKCAVVWACTCGNCKHKPSMVSVFESSHSKMTDTGQATHTVGLRVNTTADSVVTDRKPKDAVANRNCDGRQGLSRCVESLATHFVLANTRAMFCVCVIECVLLSVISCAFRRKTTKLLLSKLEFKTPPKYGDRVIRRANGQGGMFLGFVNASKTKCAVAWECKRGNCKHKVPIVIGNEGTAIHSEKTDDTMCSTDSSNYQVNGPGKVESMIMIGDLVYDRNEDGLPAKPRWMVVTQGPHRRSCCVAKCTHSEIGTPGEKDYDPDPLCATLAPALITSTGVTNKPDPKQTVYECWTVAPVQHCKKITKMLEHGYRVMCRDNYHVCLISCRKYRKKLRALYCRMRMPRRPMESTCVSQLYVPQVNSERVVTIESVIQTHTGNSTARPIPKIEDNESRDSYWDEDNTDVTLRPDDRALVVDLARFTGTRAMDGRVRECVVPAIMARLLGLLPSTESRPTIDATFQTKPFGFTFEPGRNNRSIVLTRVKAESAAAKAGLTVGMCLVSLNGVNVCDSHSEIVRKLLKTTDPRSIVLKFELPLPDTQPPGVYHVKHDSMTIASTIVGHIETFLGHTHKYEDPRMAETNPLLASLMNCNTNVQLVGSLSSAMSVLQYLSGYLSKNPIELCNFITCIIAARRRCKRYTSTAEDAGTRDRNAKFLAQKVCQFDHMCVCLTCVFSRKTRWFVTVCDTCV